MESEDLGVIFTVTHQKSVFGSRCLWELMLEILQVVVVFNLSGFSVGRGWEVCQNRRGCGRENVRVQGQRLLSSGAHVQSAGHWWWEKSHPLGSGSHGAGLPKSALQGSHSPHRGLSREATYGGSLGRAIMWEPAGAALFAQTGWRLGEQESRDKGPRRWVHRAGGVDSAQLTGAGHQLWGKGEQALKRWFP